MKTKRLDSCPETNVPGGRLLTSRWRSPASSSSRARRALWWRPRRHCRAPRRLRDARRPFYRPPGGGRFPGACSSTTSAALGEGAQAPTSQGGLPPVAFFLFSLSQQRVLRGHQGREPLLLAQPIFLVPLFPALPPPDPSLLLACRPLLLPPLRRAHADSGHGRVGPRGVHGHPMLGRAKCQNCSGASRRNKRKGEPTHRRGVRKHNKRPEVVISVPDGLKADGAPHPRGRILQGEAVVQQPRARQGHRVGRLAHLVDTDLPLHEGAIRLWWRFARTEAVPSPASARPFNASRADSSRSWREKGDRS
jgi:hypothetical protein